MSCKSYLCSIGTGMMVGFGLGVLFAPKKGSETRECLKNNINKMKKKVQDIDAVEVKKYVDKNIKKLKKEIDNLSMEKVVSVAKKKAKDIENKIEDLMTYVKENGTPILEEAVDEVKTMANDVIDSMTSDNNS